MDVACPFKDKVFVVAVVTHNHFGQRLALVTITEDDVAYSVVGMVLMTIYFALKLARQV